MSLLQFFAATAWPFVALLAVLVLGPGGVLKSSIVGLADKLLSIKSSVDEFKKIAEEFNDRQRSIAQSIQWMQEYKEQIEQIATQLETIRQNTNESALAQGEAQIANAAALDRANRSSVADDVVSMDAQQRYRAIVASWGELTDRLKALIGPQNYDGRMVGELAWSLSHRNRKNPISKADAELIQTLHSQFKRIIRLKSSMEEWLTPDIYENFVRGVEAAIRGLQNAA